MDSPPRTATQGAAEIRTVDIIIGAMLSAGFEGAEAALMYRAVGDFAPSWAGFEASFRALDDRLQQNDSDARRRAYLAVSRDAYPNIWQIRTELPEVDDDDISGTILSLVIDGLVRRAPRPCGCGKHG